MALDELEKDYDYIIVDTPPSLNVLTDNALVATGNVVIPVIPEAQCQQPPDFRENS